jgi:hypothetical protein
MNFQGLLGRIAQEYRTGAREPTVISRAMNHTEPVEKEEMSAQICQNLEDKDVHPDSIDLNKPFLDQWLSEVLEAGSLNEGSAQALPELESPLLLRKERRIHQLNKLQAVLRLLMRSASARLCQYLRSLSVNRNTKLSPLATTKTCTRTQTMRPRYQEIVSP